MKLKNKTVVPYKGEVVDLCVEDSHTYNVEGVAVHNSGGGSLVAYVLYITDLDPLKWDLPFARFLSVYRKGAPDIDTDLADRDKVLEQLRSFFGFENVVPISNYNTFKLKTLVKDIGKFYGVPYDETNAATRTVEDEVRRATMKEGDDKNLFVLKYDEAMLHSPSFKKFIDANPKVAESIQILFKQNRSLGRHAGGVLIADDLPNKMPLVCSHGEPQTPWVEGVNFKHLEYIGNFIKYDLLGLETLRLIERTIELVLIKEGNPKPTFDDVKAWYDQHMAPDVIDFNDPKTYDVYGEGRWAGIFQCTGQGAQRLFKKAKPKSVVDIAALTSIYRPGPLAAHVDKLWLEHEETPYDWHHPLINDTLKETRGLLVFQEGVMALVNRVAGFPMAETDEVRRAIMKRSISGGDAAKKKMKELEDSIVAGAVKNGVPEATARKMYETICFMSGYGFNRCLHSETEVDTYDTLEGTMTPCRKKLKDVLPGDLVMSQDELTKRDLFVPVKRVHHNGKKKLVEVTLTTGETMRCTLDHKFRVLETGEKLALHEIIKRGLSITVQRTASDAACVGAR
jgi:DNA polymerase-3 subunit alpha